MLVKDIMEKEVYTIKETASYEEASLYLCEHDISGAVVTDDAGKIVGVVSEKDLFRALYAFASSFNAEPAAYIDREAREKKASEIRHKPISEYISRQIHSISPDAPVFDAGASMLANRIHRLPVIENGKLVGIVTRSHVFKAILKQNFSL